MEDIILVGFGGHAKSVADTIEQSGQFHIAAHTDRVGKSDVIDIEPFGRPFFGSLLRRAGQVSGVGDAPHLGSPHFKY